MVLPVSALSNNIKYRIDPGAPQNAIKLYLDDENFITVAAQVGSQDLVTVVYLPPVLNVSFLGQLAQRDMDLSVSDLSGVAFKLNRYRCTIGSRPYISAFLGDRFLRVLIPRQQVVAAQQVFEERLVA